MTTNRQYIVEGGERMLDTALTGKSREELDDLLAMYFSEEAELDVAYIEVILAEIREREGAEVPLDQAWADFKEFVKEREDL